jgi:hypothetical protein
VVRGEEEAWARRWTAGTPEAAINAGGSVRGRFRERKGAGRLEAVSIECSAHWREGEARGEVRGRGEVGGRRDQGGGAGVCGLKTALTGRPHLSATRGVRGR